MFYTERLMLRALNPESDARAFTQWLNDEEIAAVMSTDVLKPISSGGAKAACEKWVKASEESELPIFAICAKPHESDMPSTLAPHEDLFVKDGKARYDMIGCLMLSKHGPGSINRCVSFGIVLTPEMTGKGFGTEIMRWACGYVFERLGMHRFELRTTVRNHRAINCYTKVGFIREGVHRKALYSKGEWQDVVTMAILAEDWRESK